MTLVRRTVPAVTGTALLSIALCAVVEGHYLQIEWQTSPVPPMIWWFAAEVAGVVAAPVFFLAAGLGLGTPSLSDVLLTRVVPNLAWYVLSMAATLIVLWRYGPVYGLPPVRDAPELLRLVLLPPTALSLTYALALFPLLAWMVRGLPIPQVLVAAVTVAALTAVAAAGSPAWATTAGITRHLLFFLIGWRLGGKAENLVVSPVARPLAAVGRAAAPIGALAVPVVAAIGGILVNRLSALDGLPQALVAAVEPPLAIAVIVAAGLIGNRVLLLPLRPAT